MQHSGLTGFEIGKSLLYARARADFCILTALFSPSFSGTGTRKKAFFRDGKSAFFVRDVKKPPSRFARRTEKRLHGGKGGGNGKRRERRNTAGKGNTTQRYVAFYV